MKTKVEQNQCKKTKLNLMQIASKRKLTWHEETKLNQLDKQITNIMLKAENNIKGQIVPTHGPQNSTTL